jgi:hypothetical protein
MSYSAHMAAGREKDQRGARTSLAQVQQVSRVRQVSSQPAVNLVAMLLATAMLLVLWTLRWGGRREG